jgi:hypothetical protein
MSESATAKPKPDVQNLRVLLAVLDFNIGFGAVCQSTDKATFENTDPVHFGRRPVIETGSDGP